MFVEKLAAHLRRADAIACLSVSVCRLVHGPGSLVQLGCFDVTVELQKKRRRVVPLLSALEHFSGLLQQSRPCERLARQPAVFGELRVIRGRACDGEATETLLQ